jgi:hypothetical protein
MLVSIFVSKRGFIFLPNVTQKSAIIPIEPLIIFVLGLKDVVLILLMNCTIVGTEFMRISVFFKSFRVWMMHEIHSSEFSLKLSKYSISSGS